MVSGGLMWTQMCVDLKDHERPHSRLDHINPPCYRVFTSCTIARFSVFCSVSLVSR